MPALAVAAWAALTVPTTPLLPRTRQTVLDLARQLTRGSFLRPTATLAAAGMTLAALLPGIGGVLGAAVITGCGVGLATPLGFAHLAATTRPERLGQTLGAAEVGRELGDAGDPLIVGALAVALSLGAGLIGLAALVALAGIAVANAHTTPDTDG
ncbi:MAG: hypothetical protein ACRDSP_24005 [Pseudonocardiaceae bacterium]